MAKQLYLTVILLLLIYRFNCQAVHIMRLVRGYLVIIKFLALKVELLGLLGIREILTLRHCTFVVLIAPILLHNW